MRPASVEEAAEAVRAHEQVRVAGARTKGRLCEGDGELLETAALRGITEYDASEYTFTALAGTPVAEVEEALAGKGQYLPFDPLFVEEGATLGGTVASGISGPGRFRYGGLRDFLIGVQFVDGTGRLIRGGGKVVKNAAGFDFPKFMVGSLGRFGVLTELTFKVFPAAPAHRTVKVISRDPADAVERIAAVASSRWEAEAIEWSPAAGAVEVRLGGPEEAVATLAKEVAARWPGEAEVRNDEDAGIGWSARAQWWGGDQILMKVPGSPSRLADLEAGLSPLGEIERLYSCGGAVAWIAAPAEDFAAVGTVLDEMGLRGMVVLGSGEVPLWAGTRRDDDITVAVKKALDPDDRYPAL